MVHYAFNWSQIKIFKCFCSPVLKGCYHRTIKPNQKVSITVLTKRWAVTWKGPECVCGGGPLPLLKNHKNIGFLSNTGPDPLKNHKPAFNVEPSSARQRSPFKLRFPGGPMMARL